MCTIVSELGGLGESGNTVWPKGPKVSKMLFEQRATKIVEASYNFSY